QRETLAKQNADLAAAKAELEAKAGELERTSRYKSEFLANMSHELRTPLNSLLILSKLLRDNTQGNLTEKQVEFARNIHDAGADLLGLINDILDLSKIESGTVTLDIGETTFASLRDQVDRTFSQLAQDKKLDFAVEIDPDLPQSMYTDDKRLQQIIKNLLSNAFKFTEDGGVQLSVKRVADGWSPANDHLNRTGQVLAFSVKDSGIGIPEDKQRLIFEAFQQADGTTSRKYGGTGLGLSISREITRMLGGELKVESTPGKGSSFTLYLPLNFSPAPQMTRAAHVARPSIPSVTDPDQVEAIIDDRDMILPGDSVVLIVEDDHRFASILVSLARESGFKAVVTAEGWAVLSLIKRFSPDAIMLDIGLPDMDGWALLDLLKRTPETRHIPVHVLSADDQRGLGISLGAVGFTPKPVERESVVNTLEEIRTFTARPERRLATVGVSKKVISSLKSFGTIEQVASLEALSGREPEARPDCVIVEVTPQTVGAVVEHLKANPVGRTVLFLTGDLKPDDERMLRLCVFEGLARLARSPEQLFEECTLVLHEKFEKLPEPVRNLLGQRAKDDSLAGRKIVVIDDDIRNIFSLASALEDFGVELRYAESGRAGLDLLQREGDAEVVLVDIMMPDMDGYETIREIRSRPGLGDLPVVAVTAKAMKGDRQKCIQAGASDYVSKPVDIDHLISVLRVSVQRAEA
ncbi:MAG TPA: response regulator, partial [Reyranella sp.]|nr:response regulator [Reyranella sp.]